MKSLLLILVLFAALCVSSALRLGGSFMRVAQKARPSFELYGSSTADFKNGMTIEIDGVPRKIMEFLHVKPGKGSAFVRSKLKNLKNGSVQEKTFRAGESVIIADVFKSAMQYTYIDGESMCFMDMTTFEEVRCPLKIIDNVDLMREGLECQVSIFNDEVIDVTLPNSVEYTVVETSPNFKGNSVQGGTKPATLDSGAVINVPMFIEIGEKIIVSTAGSKPEYSSRATKEDGKNFNK